MSSSITTKEQHLQKRARNKTIISCINFVFILIIAISLAMIIFQVVLPLINHLNQASQRFKTINQTLNDFANYRSLADLFNPQSGIIDQIPTNISPEAAQRAWINFETNFNVIAKQLQNVDQSKIFTTVSALSKHAIDTINQLTSDLGVQLNARGQVGLEAISALTKQASEINQIAMQWINFDFDQILNIFTNANSSNWQLLVKENFPIISQSRLFIMSAIISAIALIFAILWIILLISAIKWRVVNFRSVHGAFLTFNLICNLLIILAPIGWIVVKHQVKKTQA